MHCRLKPVVASTTTCASNLSCNKIQCYKFLAQVVIRATAGFNLQCINVARQVKRKCCPYYRTFKHDTHSPLRVFRYWCSVFFCFCFFCFLFLFLHFLHPADLYLVHQRFSRKPIILRCFLKNMYKDYLLHNNTKLHVEIT